MKRAWLVSLLLALGGCANLEVGRPFDRNKLNEVLPGRTTKQEVVALFGEPLRRAPGPAGEIFVYRYIKGTTRCDELVVSFSEDVVCVVKDE